MAETAAIDRRRHAAEQLAATLPPLLVAAERIAATVAQGVHGRRRVGTGDAFWQFRPYQPGDAVSRIDWRQSAKSQRVFLRETEWEAAQSVWLWRDASASMNWRSARVLQTKIERAELLLLALAVLLLRAGEHVALYGLDRTARGGRGASIRLADRLSHDKSANSLPPPEPLPAHSNVVMFGDFLAPLPEIEATVRGLAARRVNGHLLQIVDPAEETLPYGGHVRFEGLEAEGVITLPRVEQSRADYLTRFQSQHEGVAAIARASGWTYSRHHTDRPAQTALLALYGALSPTI
ncbi:MAG: DUF58 domain-containing protein [Alphaproteobacteria bacterium]|nr:DUF58 domain-containing protein [Alphaproteobacteria bacterium]